MTSQPSHATLQLSDGQQVACPMLEGSFGQRVVDVRPLAATGVYTYDPGYLATASCDSRITFIDGARGVLLHRGKRIESWAADHCFDALSHALLHGDVPNASDRAAWQARLADHARAALPTRDAMPKLPASSHPMARLSVASATFCALQPCHSVRSMTDQDRSDAAERLVASMPLMAALAQGSDHAIPDDPMPYAERVCHALLGPECASNPTLVKAMDTFLMLHADHEQNASTSTVRMVGSTGVNPYAAITAGISALWGPAHGGANEACLTMLQTVARDGNVEDVIRRAKDRNDPFRLMGFGHRVYKNMDPRANAMRTLCEAVMAATGHTDDPVFQVAKALEATARNDDYFIERKLFPNVDFYSGLTLSALGLPTSMFTVLFALARTSGWAAQWLEMTSEPMRIYRPRQRYLGPETDSTEG